jgi:Predicted pyridoxal phosphate-dependent enzyme apparently involved in regulation of cell wall biogenesis
MSMLHPKVGYNFRISNLQAAFGLAQVERISEILNKRKEIEGWYTNLLPEQFLMPKREVVWVYDINCGDKQLEVKHKLADCGIESRVFFKPMSMQPDYLTDYRDLEAYKWSRRGLYIPLYPEMDLEDVKFIVKCLKSK